MPFSELGTVKPKKRKGRGRPTPKKVPVAGPYRSQSSTPKIRAKATPREHRRVAPSSPPPKAPSRAPIATLKRAEARLAKRPDPKLREATRRLRHALASEAAFKARIPSPEGSDSFPSPKLRSVAPRAYKKSFQKALGAGSSGGATADPIAELAIDTAATAGIGLGARAVGFGAKTAAEEAANLASKGSSVAGDVSKLAKAKAAIERGVSKAKSEAKGLKSGSGVKSAAKRATLASGKKAARSVEKRLPSAENALKHPLRTDLQVAAVTPATPGSSSIPGRVRGAIRGEARAIAHHPGEYLEGGEKAALGFFTAPVDVVGAGVKSVASGSTAPLTATSGALASGVTQWMGDLFSGNVKRAEKAAIQAGPTIFIPGGAILRRLKGTHIYEDAIRGKLRDTVETRRAIHRAAQIEAEKAAHRRGEPVPKSKVKQSVEATNREGRPTGQHYVSRRAGAKIESQKARHDVSRIISRNQHFAEQWGLREAAPIVKAIRKSKLVSRSTRDVQNAGDAVALFAKNGLSANEAVGRPFVETMLKNYPKHTHGDLPSGVFVDRHAAKWILDNPGIWTDKGFHEAVKAFKAQSERIGFSDRHRFLSSLHNVVNPRRAAEGLHPRLAPEEMVRPEALKFLPKRDKPWSRAEALDHLAAQEKRLTGLRGKAAKAEQGSKVLQADLRQQESRLRARERRPYGAPLTDWQRRELKAVKELERRGLNAKGTAPNGGHLQVAVKERPLTPAPRNLEARRAALLEAESQARGYRAEAKQLERSQKGLRHSMRGLMKPESHGGPAKGVAATRSVSYTPQMQEAFTRQMLADHKRYGLTIPAAHVSDVLPSPPEGISTAPDYAGGLPSRSVKRSRGEAAKSGNAESSFESLLAHSVHGPRMMRAMNRAVSQVLAKGTRQIGGKRLFTRSQMIRAINRHEVPADTVWLRPQFIKGALSGPHPIDPLEAEAVLKGEVAQGRKLANSTGADLRQAMEAMEGAPGEKFAPVSGPYARELVGQMEQLPKISRGLAKFSNASSRTILNSPAFLAVQIPQEGIPLLATMGRNVRYLPRAVKTTLDAHKNLNPEQLAEIKAVVGSSAGVQGAPGMQQLSKLGVMDPIRAAAPKAVWRHVWEAVSGTKTGHVDMARAGLFREVATATKVEGDFRRLGKGMKNIYRGIEGANKAMEGMTPEQRLAWSSAHPLIGDRIMQGMNEAIGNWNSATAFEKQFAPALIFYRFQRFSVLWTLYHFPLNHPVAATALAWLAQSNAKMAEEVAASEGKKITNPLQYTYPVIVNGPGKVTKKNTTVLSSLGTRVAPSLSSAAQAVVEGKSAELSSALQPALGITLSAIYGKNPYTGQPLGENGFEWAARQIIAQSPAARASNLQNAGRATGQSTLGAAFEKLGPEKGIGKFFNPFGGQSGGKFATQVRLESALKLAAANSKGAREDLAKKATREGKKLRPGTIAKMEGDSEKAQAEIEKVLHKLGLSAQDAKEYELFKQNLYENGGTSSSSNPFGIPSSDSSTLRKQFGIPDHSSAALKEQFGIK